MKGIVISMDALIALLVLIVILTLTNGYLNGIQEAENRSLLLKEQASDIATVLEKNGFLEEAVKTGQVNDIRSYLNRLPNSICAETIAFEAVDQNIVFSAVKPSCTQSSGEASSINRSFIMNDTQTNFYYARVTTWIRDSQ